MYLMRYNQTGCLQTQSLAQQITIEPHHAFIVPAIGIGIERGVRPFAITSAPLRTESTGSLSQIVCQQFRSTHFPELFLRFVVPILFVFEIIKVFYLLLVHELDIFILAHGLQLIL